jgi:uncharacterized Zn finger protein
MSDLNLTEADLRKHTAGGSFERGERYFEDGAVRKMNVHSGELEAYVQGSAPNPYVATVQFGSGGVQEARCTCPYHEGSWCKHIAAALLAHLREHDEREQQPLRALIGDRSRDELVALIERLAERDPRVREWVEEETP